LRLSASAVSARIRIVISSVPSIRRRLADNLKRVRDRIDAACARAKRDPAEVRLVAVTKQVEIDVVRQALEIGLVDLGESRAQQLNQRAGMIHEFLERRQVLGGRDKPLPRPRWHMIGHLQRNKVKLVLPWVEMIHSVDSLRLAEDLHTQGTRLGRVADILLEVNTSGEKSKFGVAVGAVPHLAEQFAVWKGIRLCGLMTMAPLESTETELRLYFDRLRDVFDDLREEEHVGSHFNVLSMGMSNDFEIAIECGATLIRVGSTLFEGLITKEEMPADDEREPPEQ